jgi:hypothetical protein
MITLAELEEKLFIANEYSIRNYGKSNRVMA